jgi:hypothetical protein
MMKSEYHAVAFDTFGRTATALRGSAFGSERHSNERNNESKGTNFILITM